ncbi:MAG: hypothetical protein H6718_19170 [Polyangiaceae bacterium]|nr:hypothetical protein [Myxococcales bacterium]MCB9587531.1 hypothetical protein [Polyangiaceae bacterium]MCB9605672.1 hypothetical protein [Polyangiaceae bacterium]
MSWSSFVAPPPQTLRLPEVQGAHFCAGEVPRPRARRFWLFLAWLAVLPIGCSGRPAEGPADFASRVELPELDIAARQDSSDCVVETHGSHRHWGRPLGLSIGAGEVPFAEVFRVPARVHVRDDGTATLLVDDGVLALRGYTSLSQLELFPNEPIFDRAIYLAPSAVLSPLGRRANLLELEHRIRGPVRLPGDPPQELSLVCSQLSLSQVEFDPKISAKLLGRIGYAYARSGQTLDLWGSPDAGSGMKLQVFLPQGEWIELAVHDHSGRGATERWRVSYQQGTELIVGWVLRSDLETSPQMLGVVSYAAGVRFLVPEYAGKQHCKRPLTLGVLHDGVARAVGSLRAGAYWDFADAEDAERLKREPALRRMIPIRLPHAVWLKLEPEHQLIVPSSELGKCDEATK